MENTVLSLKHIVKSYPGVVALDDVSVSFNKGEVHAIVGENGAGKSTLIKIVAGAIQPDSGEIVVNGKLYQKLEPQESILNGISVIYQEFNLFDSLTAAENIFIGEKISNKPFVDYKEMNKKAEEIFKKFNVDINPNKQVKNLSPAYKQIVEISKAIHKNSKIIIMDEPTAPLTIAEVEKLYEVINDLKANGTTIIYISHRFDEIFQLADRVTILRDGKYISTKNIEDTNRQDLIRLMVGRELKNTYPSSDIKQGEIALEAINVSGNGVIDVSFHVKKGEILGFAGLVGAGRTELMRVVFGADKLVSGEIRINSRKVKVESPARAIELGIGLIPEDRKHQGAFLQKSIRWNISISNITKISKYGVVSRSTEKEQANSYQNQIRIKAHSLEQQVQNLSGGNQQKVVLAKVLATKTGVLIFDEPTRGIDIGAREEIYHLMRDLANQGKAIIMVSSDMEELLGMSDRILVMSGGKLTGELLKSEFSQERVLELASSDK
ncbi:sugar ABC transporter ATP-binding protein [Robertmurraya sp.]|jgi:ribose transport system ATP-binding protein|uniref:sugar ABC transporter ATP-binding protein n=1 Tax=Robertmurraya sp. TaxID=2837525 RepID=UPI003703CFE7